MGNIALLLSYDGSNFHGWQSQKNAVAIQDLIQQSLAQLPDTRIHGEVTGCSRTDAGVHARCYVANVHMDCPVPTDRLPYALLPYLPPEIAVLAAKEVEPEFHARFSCLRKEYCYHLYSGKRPDPFRYKRAYYHPYPLQIERMQIAAEQIVGEQDFKVFMASGGTVKTTVRTVDTCVVEPTEDGAVLRIAANGFLYNMVRIIAGTLLYVSDGRIGEREIAKLIQAGDRTAAGLTLPPDGLYLNRIWYPRGEAREWLQ